MRLRELFPSTWRRLYRLRHTPVWSASNKAVNHVAGDRLLNTVAKDADKVSFCPRCGQVPDGDRRMEEARELAMTELMDIGIVPRRSDLDFALAWHYWVSKC